VPKVQLDSDRQATPVLRKADNITSALCFWLLDLVLTGHNHDRDRADGGRWQMAAIQYTGTGGSD